MYIKVIDCSSQYLLDCNEDLLSRLHVQNRITPANKYRLFNVSNVDPCSRKEDQSHDIFKL